MKKIAYILAGVALPIALGSCSDSFDAREASGEGRLILRATVDADMTKVSRAMTDDDAAALAESCQIWITTDKGLVRKYEGISNLPQNGIWLTGGSYKAYAWAGDSVPASFESRFFKGVEPFEIGAGATVQVNLTCRVVNVAASVKYAEAVDDVLSDYTLTVGHDTPGGSLTWEGRDERRGYFMMNSRNTDLKYTLTGTKQDGSTFTKEGVIADVKSATEYVINVNYKSDDFNVGGGFFTIEVDENPLLEDTDEIVILGAPQIMAVYQPISQTVYGEVGNVGRQKIYVVAAAKFESVEITLPEVLVGSDYSRVNLTGATAEVMNYLAEKGLNTDRARDEEADTDALMINLESELLNQLPKGEYAIHVKATIAYTEDGKTLKKSSEADMNIKVSDAVVNAEEVNPNAVTTRARQVELNGVVMKDGATGIGFNYRAASGSRAAGDWIFVPADGIDPTAPVEKGTPYKATVTGLTPGAEYEYTAAADEFVATDVKTFKTEEPAQLPNAGFEEWQTAKTPYLIYGAGGSMFWDSGNHGSAKMRKNVTLPASDIKHSGNYSIKLESQFVGVGALGKFAAGNVFIGQYLETLGTNGVLGWGRPFTSRPVALKGYVKYTPGTIEYTSSQAPEYVKGELDRGIIYIALLTDDMDAQTESDYRSKGYPVTVNTQSLHLFNKNASNVVAYGEVIFRAATSGSDMVEFTVNLDYKIDDVKPSYIVLTAAASQGGDYFCGGKSTMYLDDLELVY